MKKAGTAERAELSLQERRDRGEKVCEILNRRYGTDIRCYLNYEPEKPWQLLFATILSAQCTDARVNLVTKDLFRKYPSVEAFAVADPAELEKDIYSIGFYHNKARNLVACANALISRYGGEVPGEMEELVTLPGVGRKTANVMLTHIFGKPAIVVDTHVKRISRLLGLTAETDPAKVEQDLQKVLPVSQWSLYNLQVIALGRSVCIARRPRCGECPLREICPSADIP